MGLANSHYKYAADANFAIMCPLCKQSIGGDMGFVQHLKKHVRNGEISVEEADQIRKKYYRSRGFWKEHGAEK